MMRFILCGVGHETHTFSNIPADYEAFKKLELCIGEEIFQTFKNTKTEIGGFIEYCEQNRIE